MVDTYHLHWTGPIVPKARPRRTDSGHTYMPENYADCKNMLTAAFMDQWQSFDMSTPIAHPIRLYVFAWGNHNRKGDMVDNIPGTIADALVAAKVLNDDNGACAPGALYDLVWSRSPPTVDILLAPWLPLSQSMEQIKETIDWLKISR